MKRRAIAFLLAAALCFTALPAVSLAEEETTEEEPVQEKTVVENITGMDEYGNVYETDREAHLVEDAGAMFRARSESYDIVNFNTKGAVVTEYTEADTGQAGYTCGAYGADAAYLKTEGDMVYFLLSGVVGKVKSSEVQLICLSSAKSVSCYTVSNGKLLHNISTDMTTPGYVSSLYNGPAPSYLKTNTNYYSYDGHYFYTDYSTMLEDYRAGNRSRAVNAGQPYFNYFQYLPLRGKSDYSADKLQTMINNRVGASSKMYNTGTYMNQMQNTYGVNQLMIAAIAANESAWGNSSIAQEKNNLFGLNAVDSSPGESANSYGSVNACIKDFAETYMSKRYLRSGYTYYRGGFVGNKASGINVSYGSDPYWGEKAAAIAWNLDSENGSGDAGRYTIGIKDLLGNQHTSLNVRKESNTGSAVLYTTVPQSQYAFLILDDKSQNGFYKVQSDPVLNGGRTGIDTSTGVYNSGSMYGYVSTDYVTVVNTGKNQSGTTDNGSDQKTATVSYQTHVQNIGWQSAVSNGNTSGTEGKSLRLEALQINLNDTDVMGSVQYRTHVQDIGWQSYVNEGEVSGTTGNGLRMEAVEIRLTDKMAEQYDIYYRTHVQNFGWLDWAKNGASAGSSGYGYRMEAIQIRLVQKGGKAPGTTDQPYKQNGSDVSYSTHVQNIGWQNAVAGNVVSGTEGQSLRLEALKISLTGQEYTGNILYSVHIQDIGWQDQKKNGEMAGTSGQSKRLEAVKIQLSGEIAKHYDVYYSVHIQDYGWSGWVKNGAAAGTTGQSKRLEAIRIKLIQKN